MPTAADKTHFRILVAGFGSVSHVQPRDLPNPAFEIIKRLPPQLVPHPSNYYYGHGSHSSNTIEIIAHPDPLPLAYHGLLQTAPALVRKHCDSVDLVLLIGVAVGQEYYSVEQSAGCDGYHEVPHRDWRKLGKGEGVKIWGGKSRERLGTSVDLEVVVEDWRERLAATSLHVDPNGKNKKANTGGKGERPATATTGQQKLLPPQVRHTDDVGSYACGLVYYATLAELGKIAGERTAAAKTADGRQERSPLAWTTSSGGGTARDKIRSGRGVDQGFGSVGSSY